MVGEKVGGEEGFFLPPFFLKRIFGFSLFDFNGGNVGLDIIWLIRKLHLAEASDAKEDNHLFGFWISFVI